MKQSANFGLEVIVHGDEVRKYFHDGKYYVEGKKGSEFSVRLQNKTGKRVLAVLTVDGLSAITGQTGSFESTGYILDPWQGATIPGWRLNDKEVARFGFERGDKSYASSKGTGRHNGVIGCAFFYEKEFWPKVTIRDLGDSFPKGPFWENNSKWTSTSNNDNLLRGEIQNYNMQSKGSSANLNMVSYVASSAASSNSSLGTAFGGRSDHRVTSVAFERASEYPVEVLTIYYDDRKGLLNRGLDLDKTLEIASPFSDSQAAYDHYCKPPKHWEG